MAYSTTQDVIALTPQTFNADNMVFECAKKCTAGDVVYFRIPIKYFDGKDNTDLYIITPELTTYGVQPNYQKQSGDNPTAKKQVDSYSLPLIMSNPELTAMFEQILEKCKEHLKLKATMASLKRYNMAPDVMDIFYRKRDNGELVAGAYPTVYPKLFTAYGKQVGVDPTITTDFYKQSGDGEVQIDPTTMIGKKAKVVAAIIVKDIYIGANPSLQLKVNDVNVIDIIKKSRILAPLKPKPVAPSVLDKDDDDDSEEAEAEVEEVKPKTNKIIRRKV